MCNIPKIIDINGPVVKADSMGIYKVRDMVLVGDKKLIGEIISIDEDVATIQVYEETQGLKVGETIESTNVPLSVTLGPGIIGNIFDGIQRPLEKIYSMTGEFIAEGIGLVSIDKKTGNFSVIQQDKMNPEDLKINPLGLIIQDYHITNDLSK